MPESTKEYPAGTRVELHPATDRWMRGDRFGVVTKINRTAGTLRVRLDRSGETVTMSPANVVKIGDAVGDAATALTEAKFAVADAVLLAEDMLRDLLTASVKGEDGDWTDYSDDAQTILDAIKAWTDASDDLIRAQRATTAPKQ